METESCVRCLEWFGAHNSASHYCVDCHCLFCQPCSEFHTKKARHTTLDRRRLNCALCRLMNACAVCNECTCYLCKECVNDHNLSHKSHSVQFLPWSTTIHSSSIMLESDGQVGSSESFKHEETSDISANATAVEISQTKEKHTASVSKETMPEQQVVKEIEEPIAIPPPIPPRTTLRHDTEDITSRTRSVQATPGILEHKDESVMPPPVPARRLSVPSSIITRQSINEPSTETDFGNSQTDTAPLLPPHVKPRRNAFGTASNASAADQSKTNISKPDVKPKQNVVKQQGSEKQIAKIDDEYYEEIADTPISFNEISGLNVSTEGEVSKCWIQTITVLPKGEILLYDAKNNKLKLFDAKYMLKSTTDINYTIADMCLCETNDCLLMFATAPHLKSVIRFKINESLYSKEAILLDVSCTGITSCQKGIAVSVETNKNVSELQVFDFDGKLVTNVSNEINRKPILGAMFGKSLKMKTVPSLSVINNGSQVIILDSSKSSVTNVDITTNLVAFCYKDQELKEPTSVATDNCNQIYVLGRASRNIHVLSASGQKLLVFPMEIELLAMDYYVIGDYLLLSRPSSKKIKRYEIIRSNK